MKKIRALESFGVVGLTLIILLNFSLITARQFVILNETDLKLQVFLDPVHIKGFLPDGITPIDKFTIPGYIKDDVIMYVKPRSDIDVTLNKEISGNLSFDFSTASKFQLKGTQILEGCENQARLFESSPVEIKDRGFYLITRKDSNLVVKMLYQANDDNMSDEQNSPMRQVASASSILSLEQEKEQRERAIVRSFLA
jgi:hypothetical protein